MKYLAIFVIYFSCFHMPLYAQSGITLSHNSFFKSNIFSKNNLDKTFLDESKLKFSKNKKDIQKIPLAYCYNNLAFFCKVEVKIEKRFSIPIKFRLGSLDYANYLEQK